MIRAETLAAAEAENRAIADEHNDGDAVLAQAPIDTDAVLEIARRRAYTFMRMAVSEGLRVPMSTDAHIDVLLMALAASWVDGAIVGARAMQLAQVEPDE